MKKLRYIITSAVGAKTIPATKTTKMIDRYKDHDFVSLEFVKESIGESFCEKLRAVLQVENMMGEPYCFSAETGLQLVPKRRVMNFLFQNYCRKWDKERK